MQRYTITYTDGSSENVNANRIENDTSTGQYLIYRDNAVAGWVPAAGVRSIIRQDNA